MSKLKPCPSCNSGKVLYRKLRTAGNVFIRCIDCMTNGPFKKNEEDAATAWNSLPRRDEWVIAKDNPPDIGEKILVVARDYKNKPYVTIGRRKTSKKFWLFDVSCFSTNIDKWIPLPTPPEAKP